MFIGQHKLRGAGVICAVGFIDDKLLFLLFRMDQNAEPKIATVSDGQWEDHIEHMVRVETHAFQEMLTPALILPRELCGALEPDEKFPLEIEKLVQIWEEKVYRVLVDDIALGQGVGIFLTGNEYVYDEANKR